MIGPEVGERRVFRPGLAPVYLGKNILFAGDQA
jgi:hypothetical protein